MCVVGQETIRNQDTFEFFAKDVHDHFMAAAFLNGVDGDFLTGEHPQPTRKHR